MIIFIFMLPAMMVNILKGMTVNPAIKITAEPHTVNQSVANTYASINPIDSMYVMAKSIA